MWTYVAASERLHDIDWGLGREYLLTNGLGGSAASTILGCNTRRYHGLLVAALRPPLDRWVLLSHLDELLTGADGREHYLNTTEYRGGFYPDGFRRLADFALDPLPMWRWRVGPIEITKRIVLVHGEDCVLVHYSAAGELAGARLVLSPFVALRSFHELTHRDDRIEAAPSDVANGFRMGVPGARDLFLHFSEGQCETQSIWYDAVLHRVETERGQADHEDLLRVGTVTLDLERESEVTLTASLGQPLGRHTFLGAFRAELARREALLRQAGPRDQREQALVAAADQFVVRRPHGQDVLTSILAGYPWFADWGRDTMIALPGLCLATGRRDEARDVLRLWARLVDGGMLPNRFEDDNQKLSYNAVDSALWFIQAVGAFVRETGEWELLRSELWPAVCAILDGYAGGTRYGIRVDDDGLLVAGDASTQLTWMDAKLGETVFTPRYGKAVEVCALWISALGQAGEWAARLGVLAPEVVNRYDAARDAFEKLFWHADADCLYDCVSDGRPDASVRPNQLLAVSLPRAPIGGERGRAVVDICRKRLLTPVGLRTLAPDSPGYRPHYEGGWAERDGAYHQGTVWAWLLGPYVDALMASAEFPSAARGEAQQVVDTALNHLDAGCIGTFGEIFDGDAPHRPRGAFAQAWSVAEILRVKRTHGL